MKPTVEQLVSRLRSGTPDEQVSALLCVREVIDELLHAATDALVTSTDPYFIGERLLDLGPALVRFLAPKFEAATDSDMKDLIALVLFALGSEGTRLWLVEAVGSGRLYEPAIVARLANARDPEAAALIRTRFRTCGFTEVLLITEMLKAMQRLGEELPSEVVERVRNSALPWEVRSLVDPDLPPPWAKEARKK